MKSSFDESLNNFTTQAVSVWGVTTSQYLETYLEKVKSQVKVDLLIQ